jgi:glycyl-tRNA synthetase beta chain
MSELLLEIGFEEMPASWLPALAEQASQLAHRLLTEQHLSPSSVSVTFTPRRLVISAEILGRQSDREERHRGPSIEVARDKSGTTWTGAAQGFAKKHGITVEELVEDVDPDIAPPLPQRVYIFAKKTVQGKPAAAIVPLVVPPLLRGLSFPKRMNWDAWLDDGKGAFQFGRPIRWLLALLDGHVVPFSIFELVGGAKGPSRLESGHVTFGHRFLPRGQGRRAIEVRDSKSLNEALRSHYVVLDPEARAAVIAKALLRANDGIPIADDHGLSVEWRDLVEYPTVLVGQVPSEFRSLPTEVLETVLVHHQKYVPLTSNGSVERFAALIDGDGEDGEVIVRNMGRVVVARLRDAAFFYEEDRKRRFVTRREDLEGITFHRELGTYRKKAGRIGALAEGMRAQGFLPPVEQKLLQQAAWLCKADLTTLMVREFPELQGVMGSIYLRETRLQQQFSRTVTQRSLRRLLWQTSSTPWLATSGWDWYLRAAAIHSP